MESLGKLKKAKNIYSSMVPNVCPGKEYKRRRIFISERELSLSEVVGKKDKMSNRAERLSGRAKRGQTAERSQTVLLTGDRGKGKFSRGKKKRLRLYFPSPGYTIGIMGDTFFSYFGVCSTISLLLRYFTYSSTLDFYFFYLLQSITGCSCLFYN